MSKENVLLKLYDAATVMTIIIWQSFWNHVEICGIFIIVQFVFGCMCVSCVLLASCVYVCLLQEKTRINSINMYKWSNCWFLSKYSWDFRLEHSFSLLKIVNPSDIKHQTESQNPKIDLCDVFLIGHFKNFL